MKKYICECNKEFDTWEKMEKHQRNCSEHQNYHHAEQQESFKY